MFQNISSKPMKNSFEENNYNRTDSPTCSKQSIRMVFTVASSMSWELHTIDVTSAFLQGNRLEREVYVKPPKEFAEPGKIWRLLRCLYGLCDAPRSWYERVLSELKKLKGIVSKYDNALFLWYNEEGVIDGILAVHVDDFVYCGTSSWLKFVVKNIIATFKISKSAQGCFAYLSLNIIQTRSSVFVDQYKYVEELKKVSLDTVRALQKDAKLNEKEKKELRRISGQLLWLTSNSRPDSAFDSCWVSNYGKEPTVKHLITANKAIDKVKKDQVRIAFPDLGNPKYWEVLVYSDATHASLPSGASQGAYIVFVKGGRRVSPVVWKSKKLDRVTKSPLASETMALAEAADSGYYVAAMLQEIFGVKCPVKCFTDNKSLKDHLETSNIVSNL